MATRIWEVGDADLPEVFHPVRKVFMAKPVEQKDGRKEGESLHDYFTRKKMKCFCNNCRKKPESVQTDEGLTTI